MEQARQFHRHPFLFARGKDAAGRDHIGQGNRPGRNRQGAGFRQPDQEDSDRRQ